VTGYNIYRNAVKIASVDSSTFTYEDHNVKKGAAITYAVSAVEATGEEGSTIFVFNK
jgi:hypothetical protein